MLGALDPLPRKAFRQASTQLRQRFYFILPNSSTGLMGHSEKRTARWSTARSVPTLFRERWRRAYLERKWVGMGSRCTTPGKSVRFKVATFCSSERARKDSSRLYWRMSKEV